MKTKTPEAADVFLCEVCGYKTVSHPYDICTVCFWEQEMLEESEYNEPTGGPNDELSVNDARRNFEKLGAVSERLLQYVVPPKAGEIPEGAISADKIAERQEAARKRLRIKFKKLA
jgi:hypothetical protein